MSHPLVRTKLSRPAPLPAGLRRGRLIERLGAAQQRRLTLLAAPAGYGKTALLAEWLDGQLRAGAGDPPAAPRLRPDQLGWLTLDAGDNDPLQFLSYLAAALPLLGPASRARAEAALRMTPAPAAAVVLADLLNDLAELPDETVLVLDDYHTIVAPAVHEALAFLVGHLPPRAHLLIATRADPPLPLSRLRARGQLAELRAADLSFSPEETAAFLLETMELPLTRGQVAALLDRTEGWPAGLRLAAIALRERPERAAFIESFTGNHRYVVDYLIEDVFARQPAHLQMFLLQTSILDRLCGPLCDALLGLSAGGRAAAGAEQGPGHRVRGDQSYSRLILEGLDHDNLFVVPLDVERIWYRYHHLFSDVLRERLAEGTPPEQVAVLHRRASAWYAAHGMISAAVGHALKAGAVQDVVAILEPVGLSMATRVGEATLRVWLPAIPEPMIRARPRLALLRAWLALADYEHGPAEGWLQVAEAALARVAAGEAEAIGNVTNLRGEICAVRARLATISGDAQAVVASAGQALALLQPDNLALRTRLAKDLGYAYMAQGDLGRAVQAFAEAMANGFSAGYPYISFMATSDYAYVQAARGGLRAAAQACRKTIALAVEGGALAQPGAGLPYLALADISRERRELAGVLPAMAEAAAHILPSSTTGFVCLMLVEARVARARGLADEALAHIRRARFMAQQRRMAWASAVLDSLEAQIQIAGGDLEAAEGLLARAAALPAPAELRFFPPAFAYAGEHCAAAPLQLRLARGMAQASPAALRELVADLEDQIAAADGRGLCWLQIKLRALQAIAYAALGREGQALELLGRALAMAAPEGYLEVLIEEGPPLAALVERGLSRGVWPAGRELGDYLGRLRDHLAPAEAAPVAPPEPAAAAPPALPEPLSLRELEVLRLMAEGHGNPEIAAAMVIAVSTVKSHVNNIFSKLGVATRTQAIARARRLGLT